MGLRYRSPKIIGYMIIDFERIPVSVIEGFKGGQKHIAAHMYADDKVRVLHGMLVPGASIGMHTHDTNCEMIYVVSGQGRVLIDGSTERVRAGECHYCPKGHTHSLINDSEENLVFIGFVPEQ